MLVDSRAMCAWSPFPPARPITKAGHMLCPSTASAQALAGLASLHPAHL